MQLLGMCNHNPIYLFNDDVHDYCIHYCNKQYVLPGWSLGIRMYVCV